MLVGGSNQRDSVPASALGVASQITGTTVYNLNRIEEVDVDSNDRPIFPPKILSTQVLSSPFDDIVPRAIASATAAAKEKEQQQQAAAAAKGPKATRYAFVR